VADHVGVNLKRLMAAGGWSIREVVQRSGLDERTIRAICSDRRRTHGRTLHRLAEGLGIPVDQFFIDPAQLAYRHFDRASNPVVEQVVEERPELFRNWTDADFDELSSQMGLGGGLTREGAIEVAGHINRKRHLHEKLDLLLETTHADLVSEMIELFYHRMTERGE
ncbi:MAG: helix-turn-helix transcriptional regulator, partial [Patescibacteria group bacterium]|nr:helix-turn-helix transcriptional regulator [Patescibacteria group bacterium]